MDPKVVLKKYWGFSEFRGSQQEIIGKVLEGKDVLALLPTGGGKSLCYQIPSLLMEGICIVVSPLIALMQDQVNNLKKKGIKAIALTGGIPLEETINLLDNGTYGNYKFLYLSPERLQQEMVLGRIEQMNVNLIAIDEAHCISQWGNDFRPAYLNCSVLRGIKPKAPVIALTATAKQQVAMDIKENLLFNDSITFKDSFSRENIAYKVLWEEDKLYRVKQLCLDLRTSGILYVRNRRATEELATFLNKNQISATYFHGGIPKKDKEKKLKSWLENKVRIMVATNAFGMGVDKPDVGLVIHFQIPDSLENYFQETGRAGRDGKPAIAILITNKADEIQLKNQFLSVLPDVPFLKMLYNKLNNYFQIPYGMGSNETFEFQFHEFCEIYKLNTVLAYNALTILDQHSVISLSQAFSTKTTLKFLSSKNQLFHYLDQRKDIAPVVQTILRTYGGVFEHETKVNTTLIVKKSATPEKNVLQILEQLQKDGIILYSAKDSDLKITFLVPREDEKTINSFAKKVEANQEVKTANIDSMLGYIENNSLCRSRQLLNYFGETLGTDCGKCDVCLTKNDIPDDVIDRVSGDILELLKKETRTSRKIIELLPYGEPIILDSLQALLEDGYIALTATNKYGIK